MVKTRFSDRSAGFSLVEMLVALVFTMVLMAGLSTVFKASLSTFYTSGEVLSSARRNRMSIDLLGDDLNNAAMYLVDLSVPPSVSSTTPPFYILPNMPIAGAGANDPQTADELYFYMDQPLPFEGTLSGASPQKTASELVVAGTAPATADFTYKVNCINQTYRDQVKKGQVFIFKDSWETAYINDDPEKPSTNEVKVVAGPDPNAQTAGTGSAGLPSKAKHLDGSRVVFIQPAQMVRYRIAMLQLDPQSTTGIPCLIREQVSYGSAFGAATPQQIITENVSGFKVYLSANSGVSWAGLGLDASTSDFTDGWDLGIRAQLDTQLSSSGRPDFKTTRGSDHWFRSIPTLVRVDVSTRTATQRTEFANAPNTVAYREMMQSLVFVPRHSGLTMN